MRPNGMVRPATNVCARSRLRSGYASRNDILLPDDSRQLQWAGCASWGRLALTAIFSCPDFCRRPTLPVPWARPHAEDDAALTLRQGPSWSASSVGRTIIFLVPHPGRPRFAAAEARFKMPAAGRNSERQPLFGLRQLSRGRWCSRLPKSLPKHDDPDRCQGHARSAF